MYNCGHLRDDLKAHYGYTEDDTVYLVTFADLDPFEEETVEILQTDHDHGLDSQKICRAACLYQGYEKSFEA